MTNLKNLVAEGVTIEFRGGARCHAEFVDDVYPDRTCGQYDRGIWIAIQEDFYRADGWNYNGQEYFISYTDGTVWDDTIPLEGARCPEICVMVAVRDAKEPYLVELDEDSYRVVTS